MRKLTYVVLFTALALGVFFLLHGQDGTPTYKPYEQASNHPKF